MSQSMGLTELQKLVDEQTEMYPLGPCIALAYLSVLKDCESHCFNEGLEVKRLGGLHVIGTSLHESRRIDNQVIYLICSSFRQQFVNIALETEMIFLQFATLQVKEEEFQDLKGEKVNKKQNSIYCIFFL